ncbi:MAG: aspartate 1-decarboxylase [Anaerolineales bacterium]
MYITLVKSKLHQARVTDANLNYVGSITIDQDLMDAVGMYPYEKVLVVDIENGQRFETYTLIGQRGSGTIQLNGAAARLVSIGDRIIVMAFAQMAPPPPDDYAPTVVILDEHNRIAQRLTGRPTQ